MVHYRELHDAEVLYAEMWDAVDFVWSRTTRVGFQTVFKRMRTNTLIFASMPLLSALISFSQLFLICVFGFFFPQGW